MENTELKAGDTVVLKNNWKMRYTLISIDGVIAKVIDAQAKQSDLPLIAIEKYSASRAFGL